MKKILSVLLAISLMLSLSLVSFADTQIVPVSEDSPLYVEPVYSGNFIVPYTLIPVTSNPQILTYRNDSDATWTQLIDDGSGLLVGSGAILTSIGSSSSPYQRAFYLRHTRSFPTSDPYYWVNFVGKITDANGYVLKTSDFNIISIFSTDANSLAFNQGTLPPASDNMYQFSDGYIQVCCSHDDWSISDTSPALVLNVSNSSVVAPLSFEVETFDIYYQEASATAYPFTFGAGAHTVTPDTPVEKDPSDHTQYGTASDQVEWYNDAYGSAVNPELGNKMSEATDMILQQEEIEGQVIDGLNQYSTAVDPANLTFPAQILNGMSFIGTTFMSSFNALGDIGFVISLSMMLGIVLVIIGRGEGALARGMSASARERRRTEYSSQSDMNKGG